MITPELSGVTVVIAGSFNPAIVHPAWLAEKNLIGNELADYVVRQEGDEKLIVSSKLSSFVADWLTVQVTQAQAVFATVDQGRELDLRDLTRGFLELLPETPVLALGINSDSHFRADNEARWHAFGDKFLPKDFWEPLFDEDGWTQRDNGNRVGMRSMIVQVQRADPSTPGHVQVELAPSVRLTPHGIFVGINAHFQLGRPDHRANASDAARVLAEHWEEVRALETSVLASLGKAI